VSTSPSIFFPFWGKFALTDGGRWYIPDWVLNESGQKIQKRVWREVSERLEVIEPRCVTRVVSRAR
jgi:hypothetical protein